MATITNGDGDGEPGHVEGPELSTLPKNLSSPDGTALKSVDFSVEGVEESPAQVDMPPAQDDGSPVQDETKSPAEKGNGDPATEKCDVGTNADSDSSRGTDDSSDGDDIYNPFTVRKGALLTTNTLFKAYQKRLMRQRRPKARAEERPHSHSKTPVIEPESPNPKPKAPAMVRGIIDYVLSLEDRIKKLEAAERETLERDSETRVPAKEGGSTQKAEAPSAEQGTKLLMEVKFFGAEGEFSADGGWKNNIKLSGSYQCDTDPMQLIRVLYNQKTNTSRTNHEQDPDPEEIDILALAILSEPISSFFTKRLDISVDNSLVRMGKPFRPLIRNLNLLQEQLAKLEGRYGVSGGATGADDLETPSIVLVSDTSDPLPFAPGPGSEPEEEHAFDSMEALSHFRVLLQFISKYLGSQIARLGNLKLGLEGKVAFEDLWMLFDAGDTIYCPQQEGGETLVDPEDSDMIHTTKTHYVPQMFRVLGTSGGLRTTLAPNPKGKVRDEDDRDPFLNPQVYRTFPDISLRYNKGLPEGIAVNRAAGDEAPVSRRARDQFSALYVVCFYINFDGAKYGTVREIFTFKPYDGLVDIRSLNAYPAQFLRPHLPDLASKLSTSIGDRYVARGGKFIDFTLVSHLLHEGLSIGRSREEINSAVIVDFKLAFQEYGEAFADGESVIPKFTPLTGFWPPSSTPEVSQIHTSGCDIAWCHECIDHRYTERTVFMMQLQKAGPRINSFFEEFEQGKLQQRESLETFKRAMDERDYLRLLPGVVPAFALRNRKWVRLDLEQLKELQQGNDWKRLVLPKGHREMVQAMVETHSKGSREPSWDGSNSQGKVAMDLVQGKGRGCIILLHGVPGVGKTSTAECVASYTGRPLYPITCGDIGYVPEAVESNMEGHFKLAHKWGCVLLLDEADVFLAKRNKTDVKRNGLVSVFLRILEYYSGILFLTTNRVGAIDDAFRSRLHLTLYYPKLKPKQTNKIWENNLERLDDINKARVESNMQAIEFDKSKILKWVDKNRKIVQWNGRQIRNAFQTAVALAEFKAKFKGEDGRRSAKKAAKATSENRPPRPPVLKIELFKLIAEASIQFSEYLDQTHGYAEETIAHRENVRAPLAFEPTTKRKEIQDVESSTSESDISSESESDSENKTDNMSEKASSDEESSGDSQSEDKKDAGKKGRAMAKGKKDEKDRLEVGGKSGKGDKKKKKTEKPGTSKEKKAR